MLKRINVTQLTLGMHLKEFCGSWIDHPFWRSGFVITDPKDIQIIQASSIREVWIDASKGLDITEVRNVRVKHADAPSVTLNTQTDEDTKQSIVATSTSVELQNAGKIIARSKDAVLSMFSEARMGKAVDIGGAKELVEEIADSVIRNSGALISLVRLKAVDDYTYMHSVAVCAMMIALARQLELNSNQVRLAGMAGLMHDLGKASMPMDILNKPGKLTDAEFSIIKTHPEAGHKILKTDESTPLEVLDVCLHHHEKFDGSGYPKGLRGDEISLFSKMGAICDVYDAITSNRPYKTGWDPAESLRKMASWKGHFDPKIFQAFVKSLGIYPTGALVRLKSARLGLVIDQSKSSLLKPVVCIFFSTKSNMRIKPEVLDLSEPNVHEEITRREDPDKWNFPDINEMLNYAR